MNAKIAVRRPLLESAVSVIREIAEWEVSSVLEIFAEQHAMLPGQWALLTDPNAFVSVLKKLQDKQLALLNKGDCETGNTLLMDVVLHLEAASALLSGIANADSSLAAFERLQNLADGTLVDSESGEINREALQAFHTGLKRIFEQLTHEVKLDPTFVNNAGESALTVCDQRSPSSDAYHLRTNLQFAALANGHTILREKNNHEGLSQADFERTVSKITERQITFRFSALEQVNKHIEALHATITAEFRSQPLLQPDVGNPSVILAESKVALKAAQKVRAMLRDPLTSVADIISHVLIARYNGAGSSSGEHEATPLESVLGDLIAKYNAENTPRDMHVLGLMNNTIQTLTTYNSIHSEKRLLGQNKALVDKLGAQCELTEQATMQVAKSEALLVGERARADESEALLVIETARAEESEARAEESEARAEESESTLVTVKRELEELKAGFDARIEAKFKELIGELGLDAIGSALAVGATGTQPTATPPLPVAGLIQVPAASALASSTGDWELLNAADTHSQEGEEASSASAAQGAGVS